MATAVESLKVWAAGPDESRVPPAFRPLLPKATRPMWVEAVLACGLPYASALRRAVLEEVPGFSLALGEGAQVETNDQHYAADLDVNLRSVPLDIAALDAQEAAALRFELAARNDSAAYVPLTTASLRVRGAPAGAPPPALFNRTIVIGPPLQPGGYIAVDDVRVLEGLGRVSGNPAAAFELDPVRATLGHPGFSPACRASLLPLDRDPDRESSLRVAARRHRLRFKLKAVGQGASAAAAAQRFLIRACVSLRDRLRADVVMPARRLQVTEGTAVLELPGETDSVGQILAAAVLSVSPDIGFVGAVAIYHSSLVRLTIRHSEPDELVGVLRDAVAHASDTISALEQGFRDVLVQSLDAAPPDAGRRPPLPSAFDDDYAVLVD